MSPWPYGMEASPHPAIPYELPASNLSWSSLENNHTLAVYAKDTPQTSCFDKVIVDIILTRSCTWYTLRVGNSSKGAQTWPGLARCSQGVSLPISLEWRKEGRKEGRKTSVEERRTEYILFIYSKYQLPLKTPPPRNTSPWTQIQPADWKEELWHLVPQKFRWHKGTSWEVAACEGAWFLLPATVLQYICRINANCQSPLPG